MEGYFIPKEEYNRLIITLKEFNDMLEILLSKYSEEWIAYDSQEVCIALNISKRKLHELRMTGKIAYSLIGGKAYFKKEDIRKYIKENNTNKK